MTTTRRYPRARGIGVDIAGWDLVRTNMIDMTVGEVIFELG